jgi:hypothetical protein
MGSGDGMTAEQQLEKRHGRKHLAAEFSFTMCLSKFAGIAIKQW